MRPKSKASALLTLLSLVIYTTPVNAALIWSINLHDTIGEITSVQTVVIHGTLTNSLSSTENLGVIGGLLGQPSGFDYEVGGFASTPTSPTGYSFQWGAGAGSLSEQFDGVDLAPGETFDFVFGMFKPIQPVDLGTYSGWFELQLFEASAARPMVGRRSDTYSWTVTRSVPEPSTLALFGLGLAGLGFARKNKSA